MAPETVAFGVRLDAETVARLDALAAAHAHKRGWALARAVGAGLDALGGTTSEPPTVAPGLPRPLLGAAEVMALADALGDRLAPALAAVVERAVHPSRLAEVAPVGVIGVARVVDALRAAVEFAASQPDAAARACLSVAATDAILALTTGDIADLRDGPNGAALRRAVRKAVTERVAPTELPSAAPGPDRRPARPRSGRATASRARQVAEPTDPLVLALKTARAAQDLTQEAAAAAVGVSVVSYRRAEQGRVVGKPTRALLAAWADAPTPR